MNADQIVQARIAELAYAEKCSAAIKELGEFFGQQAAPEKPIYDYNGALKMEFVVTFSSTEIHVRYDWALRNGKWNRGNECFQAAYGFEEVDAVKTLFQMVVDNCLYPA